MLQGRRSVFARNIEMRSTMFRMTAYSAVAAAVLLSACGGGSSDDDSGPATPPTATTAEGFWVGKSSTGFDVNLAVLENGDTWGVYHRNGVLYGALRGTTTSANGTLSGTGAEVDLTTGAFATSAYSGTYSPKSSLSVRIGSAAATTFSGNYSSAYDQTASLSALAGTFTGSGAATGASVQSAVVTISASGVVSSPPSFGCSAAGTVKPRATGKNVFDLQITFNGANCALGNGASVSGVAYYENGSLLAMGLRPGSQTTGFIFIGRK